MLIDYTYFINDIDIPGNDSGVIDTLVNRYENKVIYDLFGYELGALIIAYNINTPTASEQRIRDIVEGKEYTVSKECLNNEYYAPNATNIKVKWNGLINSEKKSLLAYWVFYWWTREVESHQSSIGGFSPSVENSNYASLGKKAAAAWHNMLELYGYCDQSKIEPSCYNFMYEFMDTYPEWVFKPKESINMFGI